MSIINLAVHYVVCLRSLGGTATPSINHSDFDHLRIQIWRWACHSLPLSWSIDYSSTSTRYMLAFNKCHSVILQNHVPTTMQERGFTKQSVIQFSQGEHSCRSPDLKPLWYLVTPVQYLEGWAYESLPSRLPQESFHTKGPGIRNFRSWWRFAIKQLFCLRFNWYPILIIPVNHHVTINWLLSSLPSWLYLL